MPIRLVIDGTQAIFPHPRGARRYVCKLIEFLINSGKEIELKVFCNTFPKKIRSGILAHGDSVTMRFSGLPGRFLDKWWSRFSYPFVDLFVGSHDLFHAPTIHLVPPTGGRLVCTIHDLVPLVFPDQCSEEYLHLFTGKLKLVRERADAVIAVSESTKKDLISHMNFTPDRIFVIPEAPSLHLNPHHLASAPDLTLEKYQIAKPYLLYVGGPEPHKNLATLIRVFKILKGESKIPHKLVMVGENIAAAIHHDHPVLARELDKDVVFTGYLPDEQLSVVYRNADAFTFLSLYEGFGLVLLEAMQFGLPIVASKTSSIPEVVGNDAILVDPLNIEEIKNAILMIVEDKQLGDDLRKRGCVRASAYSWESTVSQTIDLYKQLLD
jgi:glycosyltransferase involved in cell wall biosynthesis